MASEVTSARIMVAAAAREIRDGEVVFVGMRLPLLGFGLAKGTHAPRALGIFELGIVRDTPSSEPLMTMGDLPNLHEALWLADTAEVLGLLQRGHVDVSFIGGAQIDRHGNLNTSYIGPWQHPQTRLPGSGGACDLASLAGRHIIVMRHEKRRFVPRVDYCTSPGYGKGAGWREHVGLPRGGPAAVITTLGIFGFDPVSREMVLRSVHPGVTVDQVQDNTGWPLKLSPHLDRTPQPTAEEADLIRRFDPDGYWTG
jgi:glutaconate CoA-transferase subunit B